MIDYQRAGLECEIEISRPQLSHVYPERRLESLRLG
jgi:hypothetical protein